MTERPRVVLRVLVPRALAFMLPALGFVACARPGATAATSASLEMASSSDAGALPPCDHDAPNDLCHFGLNFSKPALQVTNVELTTLKPWSGPYWPFNRGGIAHRYADSSPSRLPFHAGEGTKAAFLALSAEQRMLLSPAEKLDLLLGRYTTGSNGSETYAALHWNPNGQSWEGLCNGWSEASLYVQRPTQPVTLQNPDGLSVTFSTLDIQALATRYYFDLQTLSAPKKSIAEFCAQPAPGTALECGKLCKPVGSQCMPEEIVHFITRLGDNPERDGSKKPLTPEAFHVAMTRMFTADDTLVGRYGRQPLILNASPDPFQIWNFPVLGASFRYGPKKPIAGTDTFEVEVTSSVDIALETSPEAGGNVALQRDSRTYGYVLVVDAADRILANANHRWLDGADGARPYQLWYFVSKKPAQIEIEQMASYKTDSSRPGVSPGLLAFQIPWATLERLIVAGGGSFPNTFKP